MAGADIITAAGPPKAILIVWEPGPAAMLYDGARGGPWHRIGASIATLDRFYSLPQGLGRAPLWHVFCYFYASAGMHRLFPPQFRA
jgi:hypothetical protein